MTNWSDLSVRDRNPVALLHYTDTEGQATVEKNSQDLCKDNEQGVRELNRTEAIP